MGSGRSGIYYTSHGSSYIHHDALIHVMEGEYDPDNGIARWHINGAPDRILWISWIKTV